MFLQILVTGTSLGLVYSIVAFGFQIVARGSNIFNFAHGEFVALATLIYFSLSATFELPPVAAAVLTILAVVLVSVAVERLMLAPVRVRDPLIVAILTVGIGTLMRGVMILMGVTTFSLRRHYLLGRRCHGGAHRSAGLVPS